MTIWDGCGDDGGAEPRNDGGERTADTRRELAREFGLEDEGSGSGGVRKAWSEEEPLEFVLLGGSTPEENGAGESVVECRWD